VVNREPPTIAHIHIGHAITGWPLAPKKQGLLVVAELSAIAAATNSELMLKAAREGNMERAQKFLRETAEAVEPGFLSRTNSNEYGLRKAAAEAITHLQLASETEDSSANVQRTVTTTRIKAQDLIDRSDELLAYLDAGAKATTIEEMEIIAEEIVRTLKSIAGGPEATDSYSLYNFREDIEAMVAREDPPYQTVDSYYLFNLVKLPDGQWGFASRGSRGSAGVGY
jgi:inactivated superfamily I helicase